MNNLRLTLAEPEPIVTPADIQLALDNWREINSDPNKWATFEATQFADVRVTFVRWGYRNHGKKERILQTLSYFLYKNGRVDVNRITYA